MKYYTFTKRELDYFKDECNFTEDEQMYLMLKSRGASDVKCALDMCISSATVTRIGSRVKNKILRVLGEA